MLLILEAEEFLPYLENRTTFESDEERERCVQLAIEEARKNVDECHRCPGNVVVMASGSLMAMVRHNIDVAVGPGDSMVEVVRFREPGVFC